MAVRTIVKWPSEILGRVSSQVEEVNNDIKDLVFDLKDTMRAAFGRGLAAPQVGVSAAVCVIGYDQSVSQLEPDPLVEDIVVLINPSWEPVDESTFAWEEACLSVDDFSAYVVRHKKINLKYIDLLGNSHSVVLTDQTAGVVQHETDHLIGKVFIDRLSRKKAKEVKNRYLRQKRAEKTARLKEARKERIQAIREREAESDDSSQPRANRPKKKRIKKPKLYGKNKRRKK